MKDLAMKKLEKELREFKAVNGQARAVYAHVCEALSEFCRQDAEFAQAVYEQDKTLSDCCTEIMKDVGGSISDLEVYKRAVKFYFSTATISFHMSIDLCGDNGADKGNKRLELPDKTKSVLDISLDDLLDF